MLHVIFLTTDNDLARDRFLSADGKRADNQTCRSRQEDKRESALNGSFRQTRRDQATDPHAHGGRQGVRGAHHPFQP